MRKLITFQSHEDFQKFWRRLPRSVKKRCRCFPRMKLISIDEKEYSRISPKISETNGITIEDDKPYKLHVRDTIPWGVRKVSAPKVWPKTRGSGVKIGVIDTGIDRTHPDLRSRVAGGVDVREGDSPFRDLNGHGTHIAGIIAAALNHEGIVGVAPEASLYSIRAFGAEGTGSTTDVIEGIDWAIDHGMDIINMSFGSEEGSQAERNAVRAALDAGIIMLAAAGNAGGRVDFPARYRGVIGVGAITINNRIPSFSNRGRGVDFVEPGVDILSTWPGGSYRRLDGTSMATAHLSGIAAIFLSVFPDLTPVQLYRKFRQSSVSLSLPAHVQGAGVVTLSRLAAKINEKGSA
ncbi:MAG: S8 family peptidase [Bacillaceae bacterium]|nr:S8 family peptidase [Bacillaceae bacterium]